jgi:hypothetical protein
MNQSTAPNPRRLGRYAGALYLVSILGGLFAIGYVPAALFVHGDIAATVRNLVAHEALYRASLAVHVVVVLVNVPLVVLFYELFHHVSRRAAWFVVLFAMVGTAIEAGSLITQFVPLALINGPYGDAMPAAQLQAQAYLPFDIAAIGYDVDAVFYALYCVALGSLVFRSHFAPRAIGVALVVGGTSYLTYSFASFLAPSVAMSLVPWVQLPSLVGEGSLTLWLLLRGIDERRWQAQTARVAAPNATAVAPLAASSAA